MSAKDSSRINDAWSAILSAKSIVDCLTDCTQIDKDSSVLGSLHAVLDYLGKAEASINEMGRTA